MYGVMSDSNCDFDLIVVGGGLAGLFSAALAAQQGLSICVLEKGETFGGRARTTEEAESVLFNLGPHALYTAGHARQLLDKLDIPCSGALPNAGHALTYRNGREFSLPRSLMSIAFSRLLSVTDRWRLISFFRQLNEISIEPLRELTTEQWVHSKYGRGALADLLFALFRLSTFADTRCLSAAAAIQQLRLALAPGVIYLDKGWQQLVHGLRNYAVNLGVQFASQTKVNSVKHTGELIRVERADGTTLTANAVILAVGPSDVLQIMDLPADSSLSQRIKMLQPVFAASLDVALRDLPRPQHRFALGLDNSMYFSVHSAAAKLAPESIAVVHVMKYLAQGTHESPSSITTQLEDFLEQVQPGWKSRVVTKRVLPRLVVTNASPDATLDGTLGRPAVDALDIPGIYLAGDWVGPDGQLADAAAASAESAVQSLLKYQKSLSLVSQQ